MNDWFEAEQRVERAQQLSESHCFGEALAELDVALSIQPNNALWHAQRGYLLEELDRTCEAVEAYERSLELEPQDQEVTLALGMALTQLGQYNRALEVFEDLSRRNPDLEAAYCGRIQAYAELGRHEQAEEMFYVARQLEEDCPHCYYHIGASLYARGLFDRAIFCWRRVLEIEPAYIGVNRRIGQAFRTKGELGPAREYLLRELREDPGNTDLLLDLGELALASGQPAAAVAKFEQIIELDPDFGPAYTAMGTVLLQRNNAEAALKCFEAAEALIDADDQGGLNVRMGEALIQLGRFAEAVDRLERASVQLPEDDRIPRLLGDANLRLNHPSVAAECYRRALSLRSDDAATHHKLAQALLPAGDVTGALKHDLHAIRCQPDFVDAMHSAGLALAELGRWREARAMIDRGLRIDPTNSLLAGTRRGLWRRRVGRAVQRLLSGLPFPRRGAS